MRDTYIIYFPEYFHMAPIDIGDEFHPDPREYFLGRLKILSLCWNHIYLQSEHLMFLGCNVRGAMVIPIFSRHSDSIECFQEISNLISNGVFCHTYWEGEYSVQEYLDLKRTVQFQKIDKTKRYDMHSEAIEKLFHNPNFKAFPRRGLVQNQRLTQYIDDFLANQRLPVKLKDIIKRSEFISSSSRLKSYPYSSEQNYIESQKYLIHNLHDAMQIRSMKQAFSRVYTIYVVENHLENIYTYFPSYFGLQFPISDVQGQQEIIDKRISFLYAPEFTEWFLENRLDVSNIAGIKSIDSSMTITKLRDNKTFSDFLHVYHALLSKIQEAYHQKTMSYPVINYANISRDDKSAGRTFYDEQQQYIIKRFPRSLLRAQAFYGRL